MFSRSGPSSGTITRVASRQLSPSGAPVGSSTALPAKLRAPSRVGPTRQPPGPGSTWAIVSPSETIAPGPKWLSPGRSCCCVRPKFEPVCSMPPTKR